MQGQDSTIFPEDLKIPEGYQLLYQQDFASNSVISEFEMSDPSAWKVVADDQGWLELFGESQYKARVRSPFSYLVDQKISCPRYRKCFQKFPNKLVGNRIPV